MELQFLNEGFASRSDQTKLAVTGNFHLLNPTSLQLVSQIIASRCLFLGVLQDLMK